MMLTHAQGAHREKDQKDKHMIKDRAWRRCVACLPHDKQTIADI